MIETLRVAAHALHLLNPLAIIVMLVLGAALTLVRPAWARRWLLGMALIYWFLSTSMGSAVMVAPLARGFAPIQSAHDAADADAVVVLGAGVHEARDGEYVLSYPNDEMARRTVEGARVFHVMGGRPLVVASGGTVEPGQVTSEAEVIAEGLKRLRVPAERIVLESRSQTTYDEAIFVTEMLGARGIRRFVIVTSPTHMRRALAVFRAQHADVRPSITRWRSEREASPWYMPTTESMQLSSGALYDYGGFAYYWLRGWLDPATAPR